MAYVNLHTLSDQIGDLANARFISGAPARPVSLTLTFHANGANDVKIRFVPEGIGWIKSSFAPMTQAELDIMARVSQAFAKARECGYTFETE